MGRANRKFQSPKIYTAEIEDLSHDGRGVARIEGGKTAFVSGALPGETATFMRRKKHRNFDEAEVQEIADPSPERVTPKCAHFDYCGGCGLQHLEPAAQIRAKQNVLAENFARIGKLEPENWPENWLQPLTGPLWGYRRRARLGVKLVKKKGKVLVGFRERHAPYIADLDHCHVIDPKVGGLLNELGELVHSLSIPDRIPQLEMSVADNVTALVVRHLEPLTPDDLLKLSAFGERYDIRFYLQSKGPDTIVLLEDSSPESSPESSLEPLHYSLPAHGLTLEFLPSDFIQVNGEINARMIDHALDLLALDGSENVLDLFCGLGNFTLPLARHAARVVGVEGEQGLVERARRNAVSNGLENTEFHVANLFEDVSGFPWAKEKYDVVFLDPPRAGAEEICRNMPSFAARKILYVSCHPASLARDAGILVRQHGYRLKHAGVMDMFPHTAHVESIAMFEAPGK